jgi:hypothetical protein
MNEQLIAVAVIVAGAALYLARRTWRTWAGKKTGCGKGCSCGDRGSERTPALIPSESLTLLRR